MVGFRCGHPGGRAVSPVEEASRRGADCVTTHFQPMAADHARGRSQKRGPVRISCVQVTAALGVEMGVEILICIPYIWPASGLLFEFA